jgi:hypothetical protein
MLIHLLPSFTINSPEKGSEHKAPKGSMNKILPNSASLNENLSLISGICEAQDENTNPRKKK